MRRLAMATLVLVGLVAVGPAVGASTAVKKAPKDDQALHDACFTLITLTFTGRSYDTQSIAEMARSFEASKVKGASKLGKRFEKVAGPTVAYQLVLTDASAFCVKHGIDTRPYVPPTTRALTKVVSRIDNG